MLVTAAESLIGPTLLVYDSPAVFHVPVAFSANGYFFSSDSMRRTGFFGLPIGFGASLRVWGPSAMPSTSRILPNDSEFRPHHPTLFHGRRASWIWVSGDPIILPDEEEGPPKQVILHEAELRSVLEHFTRDLLTVGVSDLDTPFHGLSCGTPRSVWRC